MKNPVGIQRYYLGLSVLGVFTFVFFCIVLFQAASGRQDVATDKAASQIADKLNSYTDAQSKVPAKLSDVGIKNVPSTITYHKVSSTSYKFCATYKSAGNNGGVNSFQSDISKLETGDANVSTYQTDSSFLDVSRHHKGQNCQTVTIYTYNNLDNSGSGSNNGSGSGTTCTYPSNNSSDQAYQDYINCLNQQENNQFQLDSTNPSTSI